MSFGWDEETAQAAPQAEELSASLSLAEIQASLAIPPNMSPAAAAALAQAVMTSTQGSRETATLMISQMNTALTQINSAADVSSALAGFPIDTHAIEAEMQTTENLTADLGAMLGAGAAVGAGNAFFGLLGDKQKAHLEEILSIAHQDVAEAGRCLHTACMALPGEDLSLDAALQRGHGVNVAVPTAGRATGIA